MMWRSGVLQVNAACASRKSPIKKRRAVLQTELPMGPFERVAMDIPGTTACLQKR